MNGLVGSNPEKLRKILLVEDEALIAMSESMILEENGYSVVAVYTGEAAVAEAKKSRFDLVLMDIDLGKGMGGTEAAKEILSFCRVPVVFLSSHTEPEIVKKTEGITSYGYIVKNSGNTVLLASIKMAFRLFEAKEAIQERENELIWEKDRIKQYLNVAEVMLLVIGLDRRVKMINPKGCSVLGRKEEYVLGRNWFKDFIISDNRIELENIFDDIVEETSDFPEYYENWILCNEGEQKLIAWHNSPLRDENGKMIGVLSSGEDITERETLTRRLKETNAFLNRAEELAGLGSWSFDPEQGVTNWSDNYYNLLGFRQDEVAPCEGLFLNRIHPDDRDRVFKNIKEALDLKQGRSLDFRYLDSGGCVRWARSTADVVSDPRTGKVLQVNGIFQDITEAKHNEEELKKSQTDFYHLFYGMKDGAAIYRPVEDGGDFIIVDMNDAGQKISEIEPEDVVERRLTEVFPASREMGLLDVLQKVYRTGQSQTLPFRNYKDDRIDEWLENYVFPLPSGLIVAVFSDQTTLIELRNSEQRLKIINDLSSDYAYCHVLRKDGSLEPVWHIGSFDRITGYTPEELYALGGWSKLIHPDDLSAASGYVARLLSGEESSFTARIITRDGGYRWIEDTGRPWFDETTGAVIGTYGYAKDITDKKEMIDELRESEKKYRMLYLNAPLPYQSLNEEGAFVDVNPTWLRTLGYTRDEVIGKSLSEFLHPDSKPVFEQNFPAFKARGYVHDVQFRIRHKDGSFRDISFEGCIGYKPDGSFRQTYCVFKDITDQKKTERENDLLMKELNHRVKNNLLMVSSLVRLKSRELSGIADLSDLINRINAIQLIHQNLEENTDITRVNLKGYLGQLLASVFSTAPGFEVETEIEVEDIEVSTKIVVTLGLIVNEIATNALKYGFRADEKPVFALSQRLDADDSRFIIEISNSGNTFPPDVDFESSKGFGLKLLNSLVSFHDGTIELIREPRTKFIIEIPQ